MISDLDIALRDFLVRELPIKNGEVDIRFEQPKREWSARLNRPTLNLYLYDVRENQKLRQTQPAWEIERNADGTSTQWRKPVRVDLHYMITAWATEPEDEHNLISRVLMTLFRFTSIPQDVLPPSLQEQRQPISFMVAQYNELNNPADLWNVLDNEMRPVVALIITLAIDPYSPLLVPLVRERELRMAAPVSDLSQEEAKSAASVYWTIGGNLQCKQTKDLEQVHLTLLEDGRVIPLQPDGRFTIGRLRPGTYTLEASTGVGPPRQFSIRVPSADFDIEI